MLITVGTGIGGSGARESLAHGLLFSISQYNPKKVVFFGSEASLNTVEYLKIQYEKEENEAFDFYEFVEIPDVDSFKKYFTAIKSKIQELDDDYKIIIDYTSGTKTMTMSAAFASMLYHKKLIFVSGERKDGIVQKGTEEINSQNLYLVYDDLMISKIKELFNNNRFDSGKLLLDDVVGLSDEKEAFMKLFDAYGAFDDVNYQLAFENFDIKAFSQNWPDLADDFQKNAKALNIINTPKHTLKDYYILASLLNNARRRSEEFKYDDAVARLYRSLELIAQIKLKDYDIASSDVELDKLEGKVSEEYIAKLDLIRDSSGKIKIGLTQDYLLLKELGDELGMFYVENENSIKNVLKSRNNSILAHGLDSQDKKDYDDFNFIVQKASKVLRGDIEKFISESVFPIFKI